MPKHKKIPVSDHFDGSKFFNPDGAADHSFRDFLKIAGKIQRTPWPKWIDIASFAKPDPLVDSDTHIVVINHATVLIQHQGLNILTDPVYSERVSPVSFAGPKRIHRPGIAFEDLPPIDLVLVSHNHYDHLDLRTLLKLEHKFKPLFLTSLGNKLLLRRHGLARVEEFDWWQQFNIETPKSLKHQNLKIHFVPAQHFSSRGLHDRNKTLWGGFVIESKTQKIYFAGDTGYGPLFKQIYQKLGAMSLCLLPIGAYEPRWFMQPVHMNPHDAALAHLDLKSQQSIGIHFGCFKLTSESIHQPIQDLAEACQKLGIHEGSFLAPEFGKTYKY